MLLDNIDGPADLRRLDYPALDQLADEIRTVVVDAATRAKGHLGSNLGAVELTLALHRVFDSPNDIILWDTGHQAYVHKLVTGRRDAFDSLRQPGGLSGYPSRTESSHDWIENSHASTVLSYAHGLATAQHLAGDPKRQIVAIIGDGSMTGGMAYEGLNNLGHSGRNVIIVLNDNGRSYAPTVSRLGESLSRLRSNPMYRRQQARLEKVLGDLPMVGGYLERGVDGAKAAVREMEKENILVDVSHLNDPGFADLLEVATKPFVATHSNARALCSHKRNLTDDMIREMVRRDCLIGLNYFVKFLRDDGDVKSLDDLYRHAMHFFELGARKNLALGSDFDGSVLPECLNTPAKVASFYEYLLSRGISQEDADGVFYKNAQAFFRKNLR